MVAILTIAATLTLFGGVILTIGLRGRRVGDHPMCRRCGFDLFGKPPESSICPECGADLGRPRSSIVGVRRRKPWALWTGSILLLPALSVLSVLAWGAARGVDWPKYEPVWLLTMEARGGDAARRDAALAELLSRQAGGTLTKTQLAALVNEGLQYQGKTQLPWSSGWGDLIEAARAAGQVSEQQWRQYANQAVANLLTLRFREKLRRGQDVPFRTMMAGARVGRGATFFQCTNLVDIVIDGDPYPSQSSIAQGMLTPSVYPWMSGTLVKWNLLQDVVAGHHRGYVRFAIRVIAKSDLPAALTSRPPLGGGASVSGQAVHAWLEARNKAMRDLIDGTTPAALAKVELSLPIEFDLVPADQSPFTVTTDPRLRDGVERCLSIEQVRTLNGRMMDCLYTCKSPSPVDLAFDVLIRVGDGERGTREIFAGELTLHHGELPLRPGRQGTGGSSRSSSVPRWREEAISGTKADVILRPSAEAAARSADVLRYWGQEIVVRDVPVVDLAKRASTGPTWQATH